MTSLQDCIVCMLQEVVGADGKPLNVATVLEECTPGPINKHYEFLGQAALDLAVAMCLRERFRQYSDDILQQMKQMLLRNQTLAKAIGVKYRLNECHTGDLGIEAVSERLVGIIQDMSGSAAIVSIIMPVLSEYAPNLLSQLPRSLRQSMGLINSVATIDVPERPIAVPRNPSLNSNVTTLQFDTLIKRREGNAIVSFESRSSESKALEWGCKITFQLSKTSPWRAHIRFAQSKKKAKCFVLHDIVRYYENNREQHDVDLQSVGQGQPETAALLPIDRHDYFFEQPVSPITPRPDAVESYVVHIPDKRGRLDDDEEYNQHMMDVLLGDFSGIQLEHEGKRHKMAAMPTTTPTTNGFLPPEQVLPIHDPKYSIHDTTPVPRTAREVIIGLLDISRIDRVLKDPVQVSNPKSSMFSYIHNLSGLELKSTFEESGPPHYRLFEATTTLYAGEHSLDGKGMGTKKSDAEQMAILNLMKAIVG